MLQAWLKLLIWHCRHLHSAIFVARFKRQNVGGGWVGGVLRAFSKNRNFIALPPLLFFDLKLNLDLEILDILTKNKKPFCIHSLVIRRANRMKMFFIKEPHMRIPVGQKIICIYSWLPRSTTARGSCTGLVTVGPTKV